jgi:N-acetyl-anhydromuramyl-L-alanine amidase AmpD
VPRFDEFEQIIPQVECFWPGRRVGPYVGAPQYMVWHYTVGGWGPSLARLTSEISCHFLIDRDGRTAQLVDTSDGSWCNGVRTGNERGHPLNQQVAAAKSQYGYANENLHTVSVELVNFGWAWSGGNKDWTEPESYEPYPDAQIEAALRVRDAVSAAHGIPLTREFQIGHEDIDIRKQDPGPRFDWERFVRQAPSAQDKLINCLDWLGACIRAEPTDGAFRSARFPIKGSEEEVGIDQVYADLIAGEIVERP